MRRTEKLFHGLTAGDVMRPAVVVLPHGMSVVAAARLLLEQQVRVAPVIGTPGRCVGVLWAEDLLDWVADGGRAYQADDPLTECVWCEWQVVDVKAAQRDQVRGHMTRDPLLVMADTSLAEIAEVLLDPHRRSVVVVDEERRPVGVVSSKDVLAALASVESRPENDPPAGDTTDRRFPLRRSVQLSSRT
jgi:CBS-domain-containing membrane protein